MTGTMGAVGAFRNWFEVGDAGTPAGEALLQERFAVLREQVPLIYLLICADYLGLSHAARAGSSASLIFGLALLAIVLLRLSHWLRNRKQRLPGKAIRAELARTLALTALLSAGFGAWGLYLLDHGNESARHLVVVFVSFTCIGCSYGLSSFPPAARLPLILVAAPFALCLVLTGERGMVEAGISLGVAAVLTLRMLRAHDQRFRNLVLSRAESLAERQRAQVAEQVALAEQKRALCIAQTDDLTGLPNRRAFLQALEQVTGSSARSVHAIAMLDLDGFKPINDTYGHSCGDAVLKGIAARLRAEAGPECVVARMGGDEFAILAHSCSSETEVRRLGAKICKSMCEPVLVESRELRLSASCGLALFEANGADPAEVLAQGDAALYSAKEAGVGTYALFAPEMRHAILRRSQIEQALRVPDVHERMELAFQPIFDLASTRLRSFEALARWDDPTLQRLSPAEFIPIAEQMGVIEHLTHELLKQAAAQALGWPHWVRLSFNMSAIPLCSAGYPHKLLALLRELHFDPARLQLEITETALLADLDLASANLRELRSNGVRVVLDDFGAGYASVSYLREIEFDAVKLDGSLISASDRTSSEKLLKGVLDLCTSMGVPCVAEHIETEAQLELLARFGCRDGQGFLLSPPLSATQAKVLSELASAPPGQSSFRHPQRTGAAAA